MRLREIREDRQLSLRQLAEILNVKQNTYSQYETEKRQIPVAMLITPANYYNVSVDYLPCLTDIDEKYPPM